MPILTFVHDKILHIESNKLMFKTGSSFGKASNNSNIYIRCSIPSREGGHIYVNIISARYCFLVAHFWGPFLGISALYSYFFTWQAHPLQLEAFSVAIRKLDPDLPRPKLQFVGSCRHKSDEERLQKLKDKAVELKVDGDVQFHKNVMYRSVSILCNPLVITI